jgi:chromosome segregation ATPase
VQAPPEVLEEDAQFAMENPQGFMLESLSMIKELQMQMKNINTRADFLRKEIQINRQEAIEENHQLIKNFNTKLTHDVTNLNEQLEEVRGEIAESIKQRKRERADLMTEMQHITKRIDRGKEEYDNLNQMLQILHRETNCLIKALKI